MIPKFRAYSQQIKTSKSDEYYTPKYAVEIILPYISNINIFGARLIKNIANL
mgnify:CR=1 FL=1